MEDESATPASDIDENVIGVSETYTDGMVTIGRTIYVINGDADAQQEQERKRETLSGIWDQTRYIERLIETIGMIDGRAAPESGGRDRSALYIDAKSLTYAPAGDRYRVDYGGHTAWLSAEGEPVIHSEVPEIDDTLSDKMKDAIKRRDEAREKLAAAYDAHEAEAAKREAEKAQTPKPTPSLVERAFGRRR